MKDMKGGFFCSSRRRHTRCALVTGVQTCALPISGEIVNRALRRAAFLEHFANRAPCLIGMEACGGAQHWARSLMTMGHQVRLMPARFVKAFNIGNKNDAADARAIWLAAQQPCKAVAVKTADQQTVLALHRLRRHLVN